MVQACQRCFSLAPCVVSDLPCLALLQYNNTKYNAIDRNTNKVMMLDQILTVWHQTAVLFLPPAAAIFVGFYSTTSAAAEAHCCVRHSIGTDRHHYVLTCALMLMPGRDEFVGYLPEATQGVIVQPVGGEGVLVVATDTLRGLSRLDQVRVQQCWCYHCVSIARYWHKAQCEDLNLSNAKAGSAVCACLGGPVGNGNIYVNVYSNVQ